MLKFLGRPSFQPHPAIARDVIVNRRVHPIYFYVLPAFMVGQTIVTYTVIHNLPYWTSIAHSILW